MGVLGFFAVAGLIFELGGTVALIAAVIVALWWDEWRYKKRYKKWLQKREP